MSIEVMNWAWEQPVAKATNKLVLLALADHANADGECWPSMKRIAQRSDISTRHVSRAINELIDLGLVEKAGRRRHGGQFRGWDYRVLVQRTPASGGHGGPVTSGHGRPSPADTGVRSEPSENRQEETLAPAAQEKPAKKKDELFEAIASACGIDIRQLTGSSRGQLNKATKELRDIGAEPGEVEPKAKAYRKLYENAALTPSALVKHWPSLTAAKQQRQQPSDTCPECYQPWSDHDQQIHDLQAGRWR